MAFGPFYVSSVILVHFSKYFGTVLFILGLLEVISSHFSDFSRFCNYFIYFIYFWGVLSLASFTAMHANILVDGVAEVDVQILE